MEAKAFKPYVFSSKADKFWSPPFDVVTPEREEELKKKTVSISHILHCPVARTVLKTHPENSMNGSGMEFFLRSRKTLSFSLSRNSIIMAQRCKDLA